MPNNQLVTKKLTSGIAVYVVIKNLNGDVWDTVAAGSTFTAIDTIVWATNAGTLMPEQNAGATATGQYRVAIPATLPYGVYEFSIRQRAGGGYAITDAELELQRWFWDGTDKHEASVFQTEIDAELVPASRTFVLQPTAEEGLVGEAVKSAVAGTAQTFALDFRHDLAANGQISIVGSVTLLPDPGIMVVSTGRDGNLAKLRLSLGIPGLYTMTVPVTYSSGNSSVGTVQIRVVE